MGFGAVVLEHGVPGVGLGVDTMLYPELEVLGCRQRVVESLVPMPRQAGDLRHGREGDDALDGEIGLVAVCTIVRQSPCRHQ